MANENLVKVLDRQGGKLTAQPWSEVKVGDVVLVEKDRDFPADLLLLSSLDGRDGSLCFVETANIDGETNLKLKQACTATMNLSLTDLAHLDGKVTCEAPNDRIYQFEGCLTLKTGTVPLGPDQLLLRGSTLRNTPAIYGLVLYTGFDTKMMLNSKRGFRLKQTTMDKLINKQLLFLFAMLVGMALLSLLIFCLAHAFYARHLVYLMEGYQLTFSSLFMKMFTFLILFHSIVPISLMVTMELVRLILASLISNDLQLYTPALDAPAQARNSTLVEELGQIEYLFTDKTGTLTLNQMTLQRTWTANSTLSLEMCLAMCHTVIVDRESGQYQGSSPDELAIVEWGTQIRFKDRSQRQITATVGDSTAEWDWLTCIEFTSDRKRMSVVVRDPDTKQIWLITKGADTVIIPRLRDCDTAPLISALEEFASEGLRTLCYAARPLTDHEFEVWLRSWQQAQSQVTERQTALDAAAEQLERDLTLIGCTGIEDRLQERVPECLKALLEARIRIWVLTGDRVETAVNVGIAAGLVSEDCRQVIVRGEDSIVMQLDRLTMEAAIETEPIAVIVDGQALQAILDNPNYAEAFLAATHRSAQTVLCCRVSPLQKALTVRLVQQGHGAICLAIGDGANDVPMIQMADIGVGMLGREGMQAARAADFTVGQFKHLQRLLLVHGGWAYARMTRMILYCIYKNLLVYTCQFWYVFLTLSSGQTVYETWMLSLFNLAFTGLVPLILGIADQHLSAPFLLAHPRLYPNRGTDSPQLTAASFWMSGLNGFMQSLLAFCICWLCMANGTSDLWFGSLCLFGALLLTALLKAALMLSCWTWVAMLGLVSCYLSWFAYLGIYELIARLLPSLKAFKDLAGLSLPLLTSPLFWSLQLLIPSVCLARDVIWKACLRWYRPATYHIVQEIQLQEMKRGTNPLGTGYAFSQTDGGQARIL